MGICIQDVPNLSYDGIGHEAAGLLRKYGYEKRVPVPVERLTEIDLGLRLTLIPGLRQQHAINGYVTSDAQEIVLDEHMFSDQAHVARFARAHEIGHVMLHRRLFDRFEFSTVEEYKEVQQAIPVEVHALLELQANTYAGTLLVHADHLRHHVEKAEQHVARAAQHADRYHDLEEYLIEDYLASVFFVSRDVIHRRLDAEGIELRKNNKSLCL